MSTAIACVVFLLPHLYNIGEYQRSRTTCYIALIHMQPSIKYNMICVNGCSEANTYSMTMGFRRYGGMRFRCKQWLVNVEVVHPICEVIHIYAWHKGLRWLTDTANSRHIAIQYNPISHTMTKVEHEKKICAPQTIPYLLERAICIIWCLL